MNIYVASSWRNPFQPEIIKQLRFLGHKVYDFRDPESHFRWDYIDSNWLNWTPGEFKKALNNPLIIRGFDNDFKAMNWADCCVLVLPCG